MDVSIIMGLKFGTLKCKEIKKKIVLVQGLLITINFACRCCVVWYK